MFFYDQFDTKKLHTERMIAILRQAIEGYPAYAMQHRIGNVGTLSDWAGIYSATLRVHP